MRLTAMLLACAAIVLPLRAQTNAPRTGEQIRASYDAHKGEFDYLLGEWEFTVENPQYGKNHGFWTAVRLPEGQVMDEYRIVGDSGETYYVTTTIRNYNGARDRWELISADGGSGLQDFGTGQKVGAEMRIEQTFGVAFGTPSVWRIRYYNIQPNSFSWIADRSTDGGRTWAKDYQKIEARRIGPARVLAPLARSQNP